MNRRGHERSARAQNLDRTRPRRNARKTRPNEERGCWLSPHEGWIHSMGEEEEPAPAISSSPPATGSIFAPTWIAGAIFSRPSWTAAPESPSRSGLPIPATEAASAREETTRCGPGLGMTSDRSGGERAGVLFSGVQRPPFPPFRPFEPPRVRSLAWALGVSAGAEAIGRTMDRDTVRSFARARTRRTVESSRRVGKARTAGRLQHDEVLPTTPDDDPSATNCRLLRPYRMVPGGCRR